MGKDVIKLLGDWSAWADPVRQGRLERPDGESVWVLIRCRSDLPMTADHWVALKNHGRLMSRIDHPSVLRLLHTTKIDGQPAWVYEGFQAVSLARALDVSNANKEFLPARVAVEAAERTVQGIRAALAQGANIPGAPGPVLHLGPAPSEVLVDAVGGVRIAGFSLATDDVVDARPPTGYAPAQPGTPEQRAAYGVGALLVHLLGGERPAEGATEPRKQDAVIRRAVIRVLARPGEAVPDGMPELIRSCLAFDPDERPELTVIQDALTASAEMLRSAGLRTWCPTAVPDLLQRADDGYPDPDTARMKRHIAPADQPEDVMFIRSESSERRPPREIPTIMAKPSLAAQAFLADEGARREQTPAAITGSYDSIPTSETDVHSMRAAPIVQDSVAPPPIAIDGGGDTWEDDEEARMGGWPLVAGALIGMVLAAAVGAFAVNHMTGTQTAGDGAQAVGAAAPVIAAPDPQAAILRGEPVPSAPTAATAAAEPIGDPQPTTVPDPVDAAPPSMAQAPSSTPEAPAEEAPSPAADGTAGEGEDAAPSEVEATLDGEPTESPPTDDAESAGDAADAFAVTFVAEPGAVDRMRVRCHTLDPVEGAEEVRIDRAVRGPCRVEGFIGETKLSVSAILKGPKTYTCFRDGSRICE